MTTYTPPDISDIDLSSVPQAYTKPDISNITFASGSSDPEGPITTSLDLSATFSGIIAAGSINSELAFAASFSGGVAQGYLASSLDLTSDFFGGVADGHLSSSLDFSGIFFAETGSSAIVSAELGIDANFRGYHDWIADLDPLLLQEIYTLTITGDPELVIKISSWQATANSFDRLDYLQAVIPAAADIVEEIADRQDSDLIIRKGFRYDDGTERFDDFLRARFDSFQYDRGPTNFTCTLSGYSDSNSNQSGERQLNKIRSISKRNGRFRVRADIDMFLRPGMTAIADGNAFTVGSINFYVSGNDRFCEVSQV